MKEVTCSTETLSKILMYLQTKPYEEVYLLINEIIDQINKSNAAMGKPANTPTTQETKNE